MSVRDAQLGDIYIDGKKKLWRVVWTLSEPSLCMHEIEEEDGDIKQGAVSGAMWSGFRRIWRDEP